MFTNSSMHTYSITLPTYTSNDIIEWFESLERKNELSNQLIELVYNHIKNGGNGISNIYHCDIKNERLNIQNDLCELEDSFMNNLYNWQDSSDAVFKDDKKDKKEMKKMLTV